MSSGTPVLERPETAFIRPPESSPGPSEKPWEAGQLPRVPITYKVRAETKQDIDLLAVALGLEKTEVVERAVVELFDRCRNEVGVYLERMRAAVEQRGKETIADVLDKRTRSGFKGSSRS
ncbi:MAG TPA: hypothetical protein VIF32_11295 [Gemmatimonadaceae bacterium]|jgi:hypothetical protein